MPAAASLLNLPRWLWPAGAGLFALIYAVLFGGLLQSPFPPPPKGTGDFFLLESGAQRLLQDGVYPHNQFYPLPAYLLARAAHWLGQPLDYLVWTAVGVGSLVALAVWSARQGWPQPGWLPGFGNGLLVVLAILAAHFGLQWDFRAHNVNLVQLLFFWLALLTGPSRPWLGGFWLALAGALKLYGLVLLPWLLWRGYRRWLVAALAWCLLFFALLPLLVLGPAEAWRLTGDWLAQTLAMSDPAVEARFVATLATLRSTLAAAQDLQLTDPALALPLWLGRAVLVAAAAWALWRLARRERHPTCRLLGEGAVLAALPLAFSPVAQPHHAAVALLATLWLALRLPLAPRAQMLGAGGLLLLLLVVAPYLSYLAPGTLHRGLMLHGGDLLLALAIGWLAGLNGGLGEGSVAAARRSVQ